MNDLNLVQVALNILKVVFIPWYGCIKLADTIYWNTGMFQWFVDSTLTVGEGLAFSRFFICWLFGPLIIRLYALIFKLDLYDKEPLWTMVEYKSSYIRTGLALFFISGPLQLILAVNMFAWCDIEAFTLQAPFIFIGWALTGGLFHFIVMRAAAGNRNVASAINDSLGISRMFIFSWHAGAIIILSSIYMLIVGDKVYERP